MKLLIVDDEDLTRNGLVSALNWKLLGITEIYQANDGVNGLSEALLQQPDIILCDVRMPRMDGITMLERIQQKLPDVIAIFMSGYADKEYLKAAIKLKAINYIEKPIEPKEIQETIRQAVEQYSKHIQQKDANEVHSNLATTQLAYQLTVPYNTCKETVDSLCAKFYQHYCGDKFKKITTFIVKLENIPENPNDFLHIVQTLKNFLAPMHLHVIHCEKHVYHIVFHIYGDNAPSRPTLASIAQCLASIFSVYGKFYIAIGDTVTGIPNVFHSYESSVVLLQSSFFFAPNSVLTRDIIEACTCWDADSLMALSDSYVESLSQNDATGAISVLSNIEKQCTQVNNLMPNQLKSIYYELFSALDKARCKHHLLPDMSIKCHENIMDIMDSCFSYMTLHQLLLEKTENYFNDLSQAEPENATIHLIRNYISTHYQASDLSVKDISNYANLSTSYACTFFKNETGITLNQYITEFRMEKAKQLLADPRYRITEISDAVGYSDGNYFGKSFRKYAGLSPSEYREKVLD